MIKNLDEIKTEGLFDSDIEFEKTSASQDSWEMECNKLLSDLSGKSLTPSKHTFYGTYIYHVSGDLDAFVARIKQSSVA